MSEFLGKCLRVVARLAITVLVSVILVYTLTALGGTPVKEFPDEINDLIVYIFVGIALGGIIFTANSIIFEVLDFLYGKFFDYIKLLLYFAIWIASIVAQVWFAVKMPDYLFAGSMAWIINGLKYSVFISPIIGVIFSTIVGIEGDTDGTVVKQPIIITTIGVVVSVIFGLLVTYVPFVNTFIQYVFIVLSNGIGIILLIKGKELPYISEGQDASAMAAVLAGGSRYSNSYDYSSGGGSNRQQGNSSQLSSEMRSICSRYSGLKTFPSGHVNVSVTSSVSGGSIYFTVSGRITVDSSERDAYKVREFRYDAQNMLREIASNIKSDAEQAIEYLRYSYTGFDRSYSISVSVN